MNLVIIGGGAMGCLWASFLARTGANNVQIIEKNQERFSALQQQGAVHVINPDGNRRKVAVTVCSRMEQVDWPAVSGVILGVKAYQVDGILRQILPCLSVHTPVLCLANGAGFGGEMLLSSVTTEAERAALQCRLGQLFFAVSFQGAYCPHPGEVCPRGSGPIYWGCLPVGKEGMNQQDILAWEKLAGILQALPDCVYREDFVQEMWQKLIVNSVMNPLTALWQIANGGLAEQNLSLHQQEIFQGLLAEALAVANCYGREVLHREKFLQQEQVLAALQQTILATADNYSSMYQDVAAKRPTEIDFINGYLISWGQKLGVPTPIHQEIWQQIKALPVAF